jgi:hypothetical protein
MAQLTPAEHESASKAAPSAKRFEKVEYNGMVFIFRNPTRPEYKMFRQAYAQDGQELAAYEALALQLTVQPTQDAFMAILEDFPGAGNNKDVVAALNLLTGMTSAETAK